jgi:hypothetical protein
MSLDVTLYTRRKGCYDQIEYTSNVTHNLTKMASHAGLYNALWRPYRYAQGYVPSDDEYDFETEQTIYARDIIHALEHGLEMLLEYPEHFMQYQPSNGWGSYEGLIGFTYEYLEACKNYPDSMIHTDR